MDLVAQLVEVVPGRREFLFFILPELDECSDMARQQRNRLPGVSTPGDDVDAQIVGLFCRPPSPMTQTRLAISLLEEPEPNPLVCCRRRQSDFRVGQSVN